MPIPVVCPNGHKLNVKEKLAGKRVKCPACNQVIQIPDLPAPIPELDPLAAIPPTDDPLGLNGLDGLPSWGDAASSPTSNFPSANSPAANFPAPPYAPPAYTPPAYPTQPIAPTYANSPAPRSESAPKNTNKLPLILGIAGGASILGLSLIVFVIWLIVGGGDDETSTAPSPGTVAGGVGVMAPENIRPEDVRPEMVRPEPNTNPAPGPAPPMPPPPASTRFDLQFVQIDGRIAVFQLSAPTWASAYDSKTSRIALTHDEQGVLVFEMDEVMKGRLSPTKSWATSGTPTSVCLKPLGEKRVFIIAGRDAPKLSIYDADSLEHVRDLPLSGLEFVDFLTSSTNPADPFVYFSTQSQKETKVKSAGSNGPPTTADRLGRVNVLTGEQSPLTRRFYFDVTVSPDGNRLWARTTNLGSPVSATWDDLQAFEGRSEKVTTYAKSNSGSNGTVTFLGDQVSAGYSIYSPSLEVLQSALDYFPGAMFQHRPLIVGTGSQGIVFASANDHRVLASIPLPKDWLRRSNGNELIDFRQRPRNSPALETPYLNVETDSQRERALLTFGNFIVLSPLSFVKLPDDPSLALKTKLPERVAVDEPLQIKLETIVPLEKVEIEAVHNSDWLADEEQRILGQDEPGKPSPRKLALKQDIFPDTTWIILNDYKSIEELKFPFVVRVGHEFMRAKKRQEDSLSVTRTIPIGHTTKERVAICDAAGRELSVGPPARKGMRISLQAAMSDNQDVIFVNDFEKLKSRGLPAEMVVGDEQMTLVSIDEFVEQLKVKRPNPKSHSVSDPVIILDEPSDSDGSSNPLPTVRENVLHWTPTATQLGRQTVRLRVRVGRHVRESLWEVVVERGDGKTARLANAAAEVESSRAPFYVTGIEPQRGTQFGVVWGQSQPPPEDVPGGGVPTSRDNKYHLGICDATIGTVLLHREWSQPISAATIHSSGIYVAVPVLNANAPNAVPSKSQIIRFDRESLEPKEQTEVPVPIYRLEIIADRYLAATNVRLTIPALKPVAPTDFSIPMVTAGRVRNGWVWDGILWDESISKPRLILYPGLLAPPTAQHESVDRINVSDGIVRVTPHGCYTCTYVPSRTQLDFNMPLVDFPGGVTCVQGKLEIYAWADANRFQGRTVPGMKVAPLIEKAKLPAGMQTVYRRWHAGYTAEGDGMVHVALLGALYRVPLPKDGAASKEFRFDELQSELALSAVAKSTVKYSAPGASLYRLELLNNRSTPRDVDPALVSLESPDGTFEIPPLDVDSLIGHLLFRLDLSNSTADSEKKMAAISSYTKRYGPVFKQLTGRSLKGIPTFVYANVLAEHADGQRKAALCHCYVIELPVDRVRSAIGR